MLQRVTRDLGQALCSTLEHDDG